ncbi:hypothetical protein FQN57_004759 [Myotisia sp. PD_48]|nr:hypothetical protein FQN57_004759 [Myotisia sp. PD_48]
MPRKTSTPTTTPRKGKASGGKGTVKKATAASQSPKEETSPQSCLVCGTNLVLLVTCSLLMSTVLFSASVPITQGDLAWKARRVDLWWEVIGLLSWRTFELVIGWISGYDARDMACFMLLIHLPTYSLLTNFYNVRPTTILTVSAITVFASAAPFLYFRPLDHSRSSRHPILTDRPTTFCTIVVASLVYTLALYSSFVTWLPTFLVTYFNEIPDLRILHEGPKAFFILFLNLLPAGYATREFLFVSSGSQPQQEPEGYRLRSSTASRRQQREPPNELLITYLYRTVWQNQSQKRKVLISRSIVLASMIVANAVVQLGVMVYGVEMKGALGWGSIWSLSTLVITIFYGWVEAVVDV